MAPLYPLEHREFAIMTSSKIRGSKMKLSNVNAPRAVATSGAADVSAASALGAAVSSVVAPDAVHVGAQTERVQAAQAQLAAMPEVDAARVAEIKAALARGDIPFDAQKIAGLVVRHHGGRG